jgi:hypothetical protein
MKYKMLKDTWTGSDLQYKITEGYYGSLNMSVPQLRNYVVRGYNTMLGDGGAMSERTLRTPLGGSRSVYNTSIYQSSR